MIVFKLPAQTRQIKNLAKVLHRTTKCALLTWKERTVLCITLVCLGNLTLLYSDSV